MSEAALPAWPAMDKRMPRSEPCRRHAAQRGFAYVWLLLLVALFGAGLSLAAQMESTLTQRDKEQELLAIGRQFRHAIGSYYKLSLASGLQRYPGSLEDLLRDGRVPGIKRHLRKIFVDPMTGKAEWGLIKVGGRIVGVHSLSAKKPLKQGGFADDMNFSGANAYAEWRFVHAPADAVSGSGASGVALSP